MKRSSLLARYAGFAFSIGGARVSGLLITSLTFPYLVRRLGVATYGRWSYVVAVCGFLGIIANPGLGTYATQQVAARREEAFYLIPDIVAVRALSSVVAALVLCVVAFFETRTDVRQLLYWFGFGILIVNLLACDYLLTALEMFHANSLLTVIQQGLYAIGVFRFVRSPNDVIWLPISVMGSSLLPSIAGWIFLRSHGFRPKWKITPANWSRILVPSMHYAASSLMSNIYSRSGHIMVRWFLGDYALGLYAAATRFVEILRHFVSILLNVLMPRMAKAARTDSGVLRLARFSFVIIAMISAPLTVGLIATAQMIVPWFMGATYVAAIPLVQWAAPYLITASMASLLSGTVLYAMGRHRAYLASTGGGAIAGVLLYAGLIAAMGLSGACLALVLAEATVASIAYLLLPPDLRSFWKNPLLIYIAGSTLVMEIVVRGVSRLTMHPAIVISVGGVVYVSGCLWPFKKWLTAQLNGVS